MRIEHIFISKAHNYFGHHGQPAGTEPMQEIAEAQLVAGRGIVGDRFFDYKEDYKGQVTLFSLEVFQSLCAEFDVRDKGPEVLRRNVITAGGDLNRLIGARFELQGVELEVVCECSPCYWMDQAFHAGAEAFLKGRGGVRARILRGGVVRSGAAG
ncbi:MAG: molybdenum cofactor biosysynthesis protein [Verrucomicrobiales bacterium]|nr:molybdenum cofactor biosysynthesis protein [Verrucomicrobiales bacterium]